MKRTEVWKERRRGAYLNWMIRTMKETIIFVANRKISEICNQQNTKLVKSDNDMIYNVCYHILYCMIFN